MARHTAVVWVDVRVVVIVPTWTMDVVVVAIVESDRVRSANPGVVGRHSPHKSGTRMAGAEAEGLSSTVDIAAID